MAVTGPMASQTAKTICRRAIRVLLVAYFLVLLALMLLEPWLVYPVPLDSLGNWNPVGLNHEDVWFQSEDGTKLNGWFVPHPSPRRIILYCHGNGEHIAMNADLAARLRDELHASVFLFDYRGYGRSEGRPNEAGCLADGRAAQRWLAARTGRTPDQVVVMGRSLGGGVAVALAAELGAAALVLENTFPSLTATAAVHYPWVPVKWVMDNRYDSLSRIRRYQGPVLQCHGCQDRVVPIHLGRQLFEAAGSSISRWIEFPDLDHNGPWPTSYYHELAEFLAQLDAAGPP
jgi:fermentation-respiration switch protein FrsA (DUF1100 family)